MDRIARMRGQGCPFSFQRIERSGDVKAADVIFWITVAVLLLGCVAAWLPDLIEKLRLPTVDEMEQDLEDLL